MKAAALLAAVAAALACNELTGSFGDVIALQVDGAASRRLEEGTTLALSATALDRGGDTVAAEVRWAVVDTAPGIAVDEATGLVTAMTPGGPWRVQARVGELRASPVSVTVTGAPDSIAIVGDTVFAGTGTTAVAPMTVRVFDLTTSPGTVGAAPGVAVRFVVAGATGTGLVLRPSSAADSLATADSTIVLASGTGAASAVVRATSARSDTVFVDAFVVTAVGGAVTGSPVRFTIRFQ